MATRYGLPSTSIFTLHSTRGRKVCRTPRAGVQLRVEPPGVPCCQVPHHLRKGAMWLACPERVPEAAACLLVSRSMASFFVGGKKQIPALPSFPSPYRQVEYNVSTLQKPCTLREESLGKGWVWRVSQGRGLLCKDVLASICPSGLHFQLSSLWYMVERKNPQ